MTLLIVVAYLATTVLPAAWAMRSEVERPQPARCHGENRDGTLWVLGRRYCKKYCDDSCWREDYRSFDELGVIGIGMFCGLLWPLLALPALAVHIAKRKPTPHALKRRIAELEAETEMGR